MSRSSTARCAAPTANSSALAQARLGARKGRHQARRHGGGDAVEHAADAGGASRRADGGRGAALAQHAARRRHHRLPARPRRGQGRDRRPRIFRRHGRGAEAGGGQSAGHRLRRPGLSRRRAFPEGRAARRHRLRGFRRRRRSGFRLGDAGRRMGRDLAQLHVGDDRQSEGRRLSPSRRGADGLRQRHRLGHGPAPGLSVDAADVPLQRLVLSVDAGRPGRHACLPALGPGEGDV